MCDGIRDIQRPMQMRSRRKSLCPNALRLIQRRRESRASPVECPVKVSVCQRPARYCEACRGAYRCHSQPRPPPTGPAVRRAPPGHTPEAPWRPEIGGDTMPATCTGCRLRGGLRSQCLSPKGQRCRGAGGTNHAHRTQTGGRPCGLGVGIAGVRRPHAGSGGGTPAAPQYHLHLGRRPGLHRSGLLRKHVLSNPPYRPHGGRGLAIHKRLYLRPELPAHARRLDVRPIRPAHRGVHGGEYRAVPLAHPAPPARGQRRKTPARQTHAWPGPKTMRLQDRAFREVAPWAARAVSPRSPRVRRGHHLDGKALRLQHPAPGEVPRGHLPGRLPHRQGD